MDLKVQVPVNSILALLIEKRAVIDVYGDFEVLIKRMEENLRV